MLWEIALKIKPKKISSYVFSHDDRLLIDTNIWYYLYGPSTQSFPYETQMYSSALREMVRANSRVYLDALVLSEFINRCSRFEHAYQRPDESSQDFKAFRKSPEFKPVAQGIASAVRSITKNCSFIDIGFNSFDISRMLTQYESGGFDFNDQIIAELCKADGLTLITHDADFKDLDVPILTAHKKLLSLN